MRGRGNESATIELLCFMISDGHFVVDIQDDYLLLEWWQIIGLGQQSVGGCSDDISPILVAEMPGDAVNGVNSKPEVGIVSNGIVNSAVDIGYDYHVGFDGIEDCGIGFVLNPGCHITGPIMVNLAWGKELEIEYENQNKHKTSYLKDHSKAIRHGYN